MIEVVDGDSSQMFKVGQNRKSDPGAVAHDFVSSATLGT